MVNRKVEERPEIQTITTGAELRRWYWLKDELMRHARVLGVKTYGGKFTILDRIAHFLDSGEIDWPGDKKIKTSSKFDWHTEQLEPETIITDSYKSSQNVRRFFKTHTGSSFKFNIEFMNWMKSNRGKTLADAILEYDAMKKRELQSGFQTKIADHNQFNQYTRDILADNPEMEMDKVLRYWALKTKLPSDTGRHIYEPSDLQLE